MNKSRQELLQVARRRLEKGQYSVEQREQILRMLELMLALAQEEEKTEENARAASKLFSNITNHHNLLAIIQQQAGELNALKQITFNLTSSLKMEIILDAIVAEAMHLIKNARDTHIFLYVDEKLTFGSSLDSDGNRNQGYVTPRTNGLTYTVARTRKTIVVDDISSHFLAIEGTDDWAGSIVGIPLMLGEKVVGVMNTARWSKGGFSPSELRLLDLLADHAALTIMNAQLHEEVANQALSDALTGLPNRRALDIRLEDDVKRSARYGHQFAVLMMDLDGFKAINDTYGHSVGDVILRQYAQFMSEQCRSSDFLARFGGDELFMILPETHLSAAVLVAQHINQRMSQFVFALQDGTNLTLGVSGGIAIYPMHASQASDLLRVADEMLYRAKRQARGNFLIADSNLLEL